MQQIKQYLSNIAAAIKNKLSLESKIAPIDFASKISNIPVDQDAPTKIDDFLMHNIRIINTSASISQIRTSCCYDNNNLTYVNVQNCPTIEEYAFGSCKGLKAVSFQNCLSVGSSAFIYCSALQELSLPNCKYIAQAAFYGAKISNLSLPKCTNLGANVFDENPLTNVSLPELTYAYTGYYLQDGAFANQTSLQTFYAPKFSSLSWGTFYDCWRLSSIVLNYKDITYLHNGVFYNTDIDSMNLPACSGLRSWTFQYCSKLSIFSGPSIWTVGSEAFAGCSALTSAFLPRTYTISYRAFRNCNNLPSIVLPSANTIASYAFSGCRNLSALVLLSNTKCNLSSSNAFWDTPLATSTYLGYYGSIYVPSGLVNQYKTAANWSYYADRITAFDINSTPIAIEMASEYIFTNEFNTAVISAIPESRALSNKYILDGAFSSCQNLLEVSLPLNYYIGSNAFNNCLNLSTVDLSTTEIIESCAFANCTNLTSINMSKVIRLCYSAFQNCSNLKGILSLSSTRIEGYAFTNCGFSKVYLNNCTLSYNAFASCQNLEEIYLQNIDFGDNSYGGSATGTFQSCSNLRIATLKNVTGLPSYIFENCEKLEAVDLDENITMVYARAFYNCKNLSEIILPNWKYIMNASSAFYSCTGLKSVNLTKVTDIHYTSDMFYGCTALETLNAPEVSIIQGCSNLFKYCYALQSAYFPKLEHIRNCSSLFYYCSSLSTIDMPIINTISGSGVFNYCGAQTINMPQLATISGSYIFQGIKIETLSLPKLSQIGGSYVFANCLNLKSIYLPELSCGNMDTTNCPYLFASCPGLENINFNNDLPRLTAIPSGMFYRCSNIRTIIASNITQVGQYAFNGCWSLSTVIMPNVLTLDSNAFYNCSYLQEIKLQKVSRISGYVFYSCHMLPSIILPNCVSITYKTFTNCHTLSAIYLLADQSIDFDYNDLISEALSLYMQSTPIRDSSYLGYYGSIYMRRSNAERLLSYAAAKNDTQLMDRIVGLSDEAADAIIEAQNY